VLAQRRGQQDKSGLRAVRRLRLLEKNESTVMRSLGLSAMTGARKNFYEWHIRDALKLRQEGNGPGITPPRK
jgi:hypothetical protein